ncbi:MAG TPA: hypothetical protein VN694_03740 [Caulobacteraceae bacterium]|nr:hypothetical protein [Caulobacteraceae bacterium]
MLLAVAAFSQRVFIDGDTNWHVAAGRWILAHHTIPTTDPFSFTFFGKPWIAHEWGSEVLMALAYLAAGWSGVVLFIGLCAGLAFWMIAQELRLWMGPVGQIIGLALTFSCLEPFLYARPHIIATPVLVFWTRQLLAARRNGRAPPLELAPLMVLWANLHASFIFGLALIGPFALEALTSESDKLRVVRGWGLFGVVAGAFALATPHGFAGILFPFMVLGMKVLPNILEWRGANFQNLTLFEGVLLITLFLGLWRGVKVPIFRLILLVGLVHMALQHVRQEAVLAALAPLLLAEPFGRALKPARDGPRLTPPVGWKPSWRVPSVLIASVLAVGALGVVGTRLSIPLVRRDNPNVPVTAIAHVPPQLMGQPVLNEYAFGGYLIFKGVKVFIDGRADMYGDAWVQQYLAIVGGAQPDVDKAFKRWNIAWAIVSPKDGIVRLLDARPGWRRLYSDPYAVLFAREDALAAPAPKPAVTAPPPGAAK